MFSGIIRNLGKVKEITKKNNIFLAIESGELAQDSKPGDSIAVDGVCLTVITVKKSVLVFELIPQTWKLTGFQFVKEGSVLNLEKSLKMSDYLDGHLLMGHVDGLGTVKSVTSQGNVRGIEFTPPADLKRFIALRGGISVNGVSLTVSHLTDKAFSVSLTEYTLNNTNLGALKVGSKVNLEVDMVGRYLDNLLRYQNPRSGEGEYK